MKEPNEEQERETPEEPLPEPDALLDALVDSDKEAPPRRRTSKTLIAACLLSGLGVWQILHVSNGGEPLFQLPAKSKAAPTKLRSDGRVPLGKVLQSSDPIAAYLERAKRGMTDQEIRWMIEDFQTAGLDEEDHSLKGILRARQQVWYLEALSEGLQLSRDQKARAKAAMDELLAGDLEAFEKGIAGVGNTEELSSVSIPEPTPIAPFANSRTWLTKLAYAPWKLCDLSEGQERITVKKWVTSPTGSLLPSNDPFAPQDSTVPWFNSFRPIIQDPATGNMNEFPEPESSPEASSSSATYAGIIRTGDLFPLTPEQSLWAHRESISTQARLLHPAQLRMALLLDPDLGGALLAELDPPASISQSFGSSGKVVEKPTKELPTIITQPETPVDPVPEPDSR